MDYISPMTTKLPWHSDLVIMILNLGYDPDHSQQLITLCPRAQSLFIYRMLSKKMLLMIPISPNPRFRLWSRLLHMLHITSLIQWPGFRLQSRLLHKLHITSLTQWPGFRPRSRLLHKLHITSLTQWPGFRLRFRLLHKLHITSLTQWPGFRLRSRLLHKLHITSLTQWPGFRLRSIATNITCDFLDRTAIHPDNFPQICPQRFELFCS